MLSDLCVF